MKRIFCFLIIFCFFKFSTKLNGQDFNNGEGELNNTATPNASNFIRYKESPVDYYSGRANLSIPIYTIKAGNITYPISINYAHGGIQVNSLASDVGLGWSITDTFINRTTVGGEDYDTNPNPNTFQEQNCVKLGSVGYIGYMEPRYGFFDTVYPIRAPFTKRDNFPDLFKFYSPSSKSIFYFPDKNNVIELDKNGTKISWIVKAKKYDYLSTKNYFSGEIIKLNNNSCITDYDSFNIITKDGISYDFNDKDITHNFSLAWNPGQQILETIPKISVWHVSKIRDNQTNQEINFIYEDYSSESTNDTHSLINDHPNYKYEYRTYSKVPENYDCYLDNYSVAPDITATRGYVNRLLVVKRLKKIIFKDGVIEFNYNKNREDLNNGKALTNITVKNIFDKVIKSFDLTYDYFYSNHQKNEFSKRLKLLSIQETGQNKHSFEYYEDTKMPNIGSLQQDFFGYCNQTDNTVDIPSNYSAKYYFYPNKKEFSILPYNISSDTNHYVLNGQIDKVPNELSKTWSIKKVNFPTGGYVSYNYENNDFNLFGSNLKGGGIRIKEQIIKENNNDSGRIITYNYNQEGITTGYLFNIPYVGHPGLKIYNGDTPNLSSIPDLEKYFFLSSTSKINYDIINNFFVGYSRVEEQEIDKKKIFEFTNNEYLNDVNRFSIKTPELTRFQIHCLSPFIISNSALGNDIYIDNSYKRGKLKTVSYFDKNNLVQKIENNYNFYNQTGTEFFPNEKYYIGTIIHRYKNSSGDNNYNYAELLESKKSYNLIYNNLIYSKVTKYNTNGNIVDEIYLDYDDIQNTKKVFHKISSGNSFPIYDYQKKYYTRDLSSESYIQDLIDINKTNLVVKTENYRGEYDLSSNNQNQQQKLISTSKIEFQKNQSSNNLVLPSKNYLSIGNNPLEEVVSYDIYNSIGSILQFTTKSGIPTTIIYGYKQTLPIAKIEGATYSQIMQTFNLSTTDYSSYLDLDIVKKSDLDVDELSEENLLIALEAFRNNPDFKNVQISTYTYNPLIGLTSMTTPNGMKEFYIYNSENKLEKVLDAEKNILKEYKYNYKQ